MPELKTVFWDLDGTLADTEIHGHRVAFNKAFLEAGLDWHWDPDTYCKLLGIGGGLNRIRAFASSLLVDLSENEILEIHLCKQDIYTKILSNGQIRLRPGVKRLTTELCENGVNQWIVTTSSNTAVQAFMETNFGKARNPFDGFVCGDEVRLKKPSPEAYLLAIEKSKSKVSDIVVIEDSRIGMCAAIEANLICLITLPAWNNGSYKELELANSIVNHLGQESNLCSVLKGPPCHGGQITLEYLRQLLEVTPK
ncbi:HAD-IA family hydrolase [Prochlorococcus sp. MIT 1300]|uniref:HAD-IA family hydrolase n=1 Tax=Prochlorococcus sp. MIT 1300 TaxID=3096218 RepID=UPI002A75BE3A|nr:HAD-IA family hydrolase [Prochlorococcus sp. MIT 1300]